ncbi:hypothetical protein BC940DRAFT_337241 [Gongronella butleri]|nr:hypothetical protein BC940DRAFT_337241 [Gongronella butleri]
MIAAAPHMRRDEFTAEATNWSAAEAPEEPLVPPISTAIQLPAQVTVCESRRSYDDAVLHACNQTTATDKEKIKTLALVDSMDLQPIAILNAQGKENNALTNKSYISDLTGDHGHIHGIIPSKRFPDGSEKNLSCVACSPTMQRGLENLIAASPYTNLLKQREFVELPPDVCTLLNKDWDFFPKIKGFSARVLAGAILFNTLNGQAIMINTIEMYGRTKLVDAHRETFGKQKDGVQSTSLPPPIKKLYTNVWPMTLYRADGPKLVIGTLVSNALVTSSMRLDIKQQPSVGGMTNNFLLDAINSSLSTKIFIDRDCLKDALALVDGTKALGDSGFLACRLRQIRSKFDWLSAYALCRATGPLTEAHVCQPYTVFTLGNQDAGRNPGAHVFRAIAKAVLENGAAAQLAKRTVETAVAIAAQGSSVRSSLEAILGQYEPDAVTIPIIGNEKLNKELEFIANGLSSSITNANDTVQREIVRVFSILDH